MLPAIMKKKKTTTHFRIFNLDRLLVIADANFEAPGLKYIHIPNRQEMKAFVQNYLSVIQDSDFILKGYPSRKMFKDFRSCFQYIKAAGGVVQNETGDYLFIKRSGIWDLPKGKLDKN